MTILNYLDENKYLVCRTGVEFYYFGEGCIADYYSNSIAYLDEIDVKILALCHKGQTVQTIKTLSTSFIKDEDIFFNRINRLIKKGVLVIRNFSSEKSPRFYGEWGYYYPKEITIELTNTCNYLCPFCYKNANSKGEFITDETIQKLHLVVNNKVNNFLLTGGEPTLHPNYLEYISLFSRYAKVSMITNGSLLYDHDSEDLKKLEQIQFSIYGSNNAQYEQMTGCKDGFTRLCKSIEHVKRNGIYTKAAVTLCDSTLQHIETLIKTAIELEVNSLKIGVADLFGRGKYLYSDGSTFAAKLNDVYDLLAELKRKYRKTLNIELPNINYKHVDDHLDILTYVHRGSLNCGCGSEYMVISQSGEIRPCQMLPESWFSIKNTNALEEHISGNFHIEALNKSAGEYYSYGKFKQLHLSPCHALEMLVDKQ